MKFPHNQKNLAAGCTLIELLEMIGAIGLAALLADKLSSHFDGVWHTIVLWIVRIIGTLIFFLCFLFGFAYLSALEKRFKSKRPPKAENNQT
jgi:amino acid permease